MTGTDHATRAEVLEARVLELETELEALKGRRCDGCDHGIEDLASVVDVDENGESVHGVWCQRALFTWHPSCCCSNWEPKS